MMRIILVIALAVLTESSLPSRRRTPGAHKA